MVPAHEMEQIQEPDRRNLQLCFESRLPESFFTGKKVEGQPGELIPVKLIDRSTGHVVASGPLSSLKLDVVALHGDFKNEDVWTWENFKSHVVKERKGKGPLLAGDLQVSLKEGVGYLGELKFTDNSSWTQSREFKLGVKIASGFYEGIRVHEAITDAFKVKDRRGISYKKHDLPTLDDYVWRLKNIGKNGAFHKKLNKADIKTVREFLWKLGTDDQGLKKILGNSMSGRMWETLVEHAQTCDRSGKYYVFYANNTRHSGVVFKNIYELCGLIQGEKYYSAENLSDSQKVFADTLKKEAYAKWKDIVEYDDLEMNPRRRAHSSQTNAVAPESRPSDTDQRVSPAFLTHVAPQPGLVNPGPAVGDDPVSLDQQAFVPHPPSMDTVPSSQPSMRQAIRDNPDSFHPQQTSFQPFGVPSGQNYVNYNPDSFHPQQTSFQPFRVPSGQNYVNCMLAVGNNPDSFHPQQTSFQPFRVPSGQNYVNSFPPPMAPMAPMAPPAFLTPRRAHSQTDVVTGAPESCPSDIDQPVFPAFLTPPMAPPAFPPPMAPPAFLTPPMAPPEPVLVNPGLDSGAPVPCQTPSVPSGEAYEDSMPDFGVEDYLFCHLPLGADGNTKLSFGTFSGSALERGKNSKVLIRGGFIRKCIIEKVPAGGSQRWSQSNIPSGGTKNLGNVKSELPGTIYCERGGARRPLVGSNVKMEGWNTSLLLSERKEDEETASLDSKFGGLSLA